MNDKYKDGYPAAWSDADIDQYEATGQEPAKASNGVWLEDIERETRALRDWTVPELYALYNGEILSQYDAGSDGFVNAVQGKARSKFGKVVNKWGQDEVLNWLVSGKEPAKTPAGNYLNDPDRFIQAPAKLTDSELTDFGLGYFGEYEPDRLPALVEAQTRFNLPDGITFADFALYCKDGQLPAIGSHGSLINDRNRAMRELSEWADNEVFDWAVDEIASPEGISEEALLARAIELIGGEWYWTQGDVKAYLIDDTVPEPEEIDFTLLTTAQQLRFARDTHLQTVVDHLVATLKREVLRPDEFAKRTDFVAVPDAWSADDIKGYVVHEILPPVVDNLWLGDITRAGRNPNELTFDELEAVYRGVIEVDNPQAGLNRIVAFLYRENPSQYGALYQEEALAAYYDQIPPKRNSDGVLVRDRERDLIGVEEWSDELVRDLAAGKIETAQTVFIDALIDSRTLRWADVGDLAQRRAWFMANSGPALTPNGVFVDDPRRESKTVRELSSPELIALLNTWITTTPAIAEELLVTELAARQLIKSADWTFEEAKAYVNEGKEPEKTERGTDKLRYDDTTLTRKSDLKFFADWANGEIKLPNPAPVVLNRVRELLGANNASDGEILTLLKAYKGDGNDRFTEPTVLDEVMSGDERGRKMACVLWGLDKDTPIDAVVAHGQQLKDNGQLASTGVLLVDTARQVRPSHLWVLAELRAWARGEILGSTASGDDAMVVALRRLIPSIQPGWDNDAVKAFVADGTAPALTQYGVLVRDLVRDKRYPSDWTDNDLKSWLVNELVTPVAASDIKLVIRTRFKVPSKYTDEQMARLVIFGEEVVATVEPFKQARTASDAQIEAFLRGEFTVSDEQVTQAFLEARHRFKIDERWTDAAIAHYYQTGEYPAKTSNGLLVEDRLRDITSIEKWSYAEMVAFAKGEFQAKTIAYRGQAFLARARTMINRESNLPADRWNDEEVVAYLQRGVRPAALSSNVFVNDPRRLAKEALSWTNEELKAWLRGEIEATEKAPEKDLWGVVYRRFQVENAWYSEDARSYVLTGARVPATPSGIWVRDRERDARPAYTWSRAEIKAWARQQILPGLHASEQDLVKQAALCFHLPTSLSAEMIKSRVADITEDTTPMTVTFVREDLLAYAEGMKKEGAIEARAALYQQLLNRCIMRVCALKGQDFVDGWSELLRFFYAQKDGLLTASTLYNGVPMMNLTAKGQKHFQYMTTILFSTCDPETRDAAAKRIDWAISLAGLPSDDQRHEILAYYSIG